MIDFLCVHWFELVYLVITLCCLFVGIFKKSKVNMTDSVFEQLLVRLPVMIRNVEKTGKSGTIKKEAVIRFALSWLSDMTGKSFIEVDDIYRERIDTAIEDILSTPEKKEVTDEKDYEKTCE